MASKSRPKGASAMAVAPATHPDPDASFDVIVSLIDAARHRAYQAVNTALIDLYWQIGEHISREIAAAEPHSESDLHGNLLARLRQFLIESQ